MPLYIVSTPIGNMKDITIRAINTLKEVDLVLAEDTRRTLKIFHKYDIKNKLQSYNDFNKINTTKKVIPLLIEGKRVALVSDSGTPGISDPGYLIIRECIKNEIPIVPIPGPTSIISALVCSGLPTDKFSFYGFLPKKDKKKKDFFNIIKNKDETIVVYESPHRIKKTIEAMKQIIPDKDIVIARELTKKFEEFVRGKVRDIESKDYKGEIVLVINPT